MAVTLVVVTRSLMTARMTSVLMGVVTAVVTRWSRTLDGQGLWMVKDSGWSRTLDGQGLCRENGIDDSER